MTSFCCPGKKCTMAPRGWDRACAVLGSWVWQETREKLVKALESLERGPWEPKPGAAVQGHAYFILSQQAGKVSAVLMANPLSCGMSGLSPCHIKKVWLQSPDPSCHRALQPHSPSGPVLGLGLGWMKRGWGGQRRGKETCQGAE